MDHEIVGQPSCVGVRWKRGLSCISLMLLAPCAASIALAETVGQCRFNRDAFQFQGSANQQASCLLRRVGKWGAIASAPAVLPIGLANIVGEPTDLDKARLRQYLAGKGLSEGSLGGSLNAGLSQANGGASTAPKARYFVIHDTSSPWLGDASEFPPDDSPLLNNLSGYDGPNAVAHVFVNRLGTTLVGHDLSVPWRATKLETQIIGIPAKGLFLHIELLQPRRRDPSGGPKNDALAPNPGFTNAQYETLALLYVAASLRRGEWLIPAFHASIDQGLSDSHDDPQNFSLEQFARALLALRERLNEQAPAATGPTAGVMPREQACASIVAALKSLKEGETLAAGNGGGWTWKRLYDDCDATDTFVGKPLPVHIGQPLRCSSDPNRVAYIFRYSDGTIVFNAKASVDADGSAVVGGSGWPNNVQTWLTFDSGSNDHYVNAEEVPFIVVPLPVPNTELSFVKDTAVGKGDLAVAIKGDKCSFAVVGDAGPWFRIGEASLRTHNDLGNPQCQVDGQRPCKKLKGNSGVGIESGVVYMLFPGTRPFPLLSQTVNKVAEQTASELALKFLRANAR